MKTAEQLIDKMGKKKFNELVTNQQKNGVTGHEKQERPFWGKGKVLVQICHHNIMRIRDGKPYERCKSCDVSTGVTKRRDFVPFFNIGLGCYVESRSDERRAAKQLGLTEAG